MLQYSKRAPPGTIFAIFWGIYNLSAVFGGLVTFFFFSNNDSDGEVYLYVIFLALIFSGGVASSLLLIRPDELDAELTNSRKHAIPKNDGVIGLLAGESLLANPINDVTMPGEATCISGASVLKTNNEISDETCWEEMVATLRLFGDPSMRFFFPLFFYTGFSQPYQLITFGDRFFADSTLGLMLALFYSSELVGAICFGRVVDGRRGEFAPPPPRTAAYRSYVIVAVTTAVAYALALFLELRESTRADFTIPDDVQGDPINLLLGALVVSNWGFSDAIIQALAYWQIGLKFGEGRAQSKAVGYFKLVQSAGWCVGFGLSPSERFHPLGQLIVGAALCISGVTLVKLPRRNSVPGAIFVFTTDVGLSS